MILHNIIQIIFLLVGGVSFLAALFDWEWFFTADNASFIVKRCGRKAARYIYGATGVTFIAAAIYFYFKIETI